nr:MAG TPA: hypothetical protein [Caudoviricetes sp.]
MSTPTYMGGGSLRGGGGVKPRPNEMIEVEIVINRIND